ncbi:DUF6487 domain-containing protein, partial [Dysosmobacter welbionis]
FVPNICGRRIVRSKKRSEQEKQQYYNRNCIRENMFCPAHSLAPSLAEASRCKIRRSISERILNITSEN